MPKILAVDDKMDNLITLSALLRNLMPECAVITARSGIEGIQLAVDELPDTILLDVNMPGIDGFETCRKLKNDERTRSIPVIMVTAVRTDAKSRIKGFEVGADAFLSKPIDEYELVSQLRVALRIKAAEDALRRERDSLEAMVRERTAELRKSEESYQTLFREMMDGFALHEIVCDDAGTPVDYRFLAVNPAFERMTGLAADAVVGRPVLEVLPGVERHWIETYGRVALTGEPASFERYSGELGKHFEVTAFRNAPNQFVCIFHDITRRKQTEEAIRDSDERLRSIFDNVPIGIFQSTPEGKFVYTNPAIPTMLGYSSSEELIETVNRTSIAEALYEDPSLRPVLVQEVEYNIGKRWKIFENRYRCKDGGVMDALLSFCERPDPLTGQKFLYGFVQDITDIKRMEKEREKLQVQLFQAQRLESVGRLAGGVAHDYNNMLAIITGYAEMAMSKVAPSDSLHADLKEILVAAGRSTKITRQLLAFARKQAISPVVLDLNSGVEGMLKMLRRLIGEDIDLRWRPGACLWPVKIDPVQLDQILANLCVNARDAIDGVGKVTIETHKAAFDATYCAQHVGFIPGDFVMLAISDDGCGMDRETMENIFEPFFTTKGVNQGTGLGLATVFGIVKQNNGFINVYSEPGKGTTFRIYLPRHVGEEEETAKKEAVGAIPLGRGETVLLVEDEPAMLKMGRMMLERLGYKVLSAGTPGEALRLAEEHTGKIDLLITDVVMPAMNGRELAERLHALSPHIKTIYMSGYTADVIAHRGVLEKDVHFIQKPFSMKALGTRVREVLDGVSFPSSKPCGRLPAPCTTPESAPG